MNKQIVQKTLGSLEIYELSTCLNSSSPELQFSPESQFSTGSQPPHKLQYSKAIISKFGAQALSWNINGRDILYDNPKLISDKSKPLRAGAPICFPWFNKGLNWNLGTEIQPSHGPVRKTDWQFNRISQSGNSTSIGFSTNTESHLNIPLSISVDYILRANRLTAKFAVKNLSTERSNSFELALHSYFATSHPQNVKIFGLRDSVDDPFIPPLPIDKIFQNASNSLSVIFEEFELSILNNAFENSVTWHPGFNTDIADLPTEISPVPFLCIESLTGLLDLPSDGEWEGSVEYTVKS